MFCHAIWFWYGAFEIVCHFAIILSCGCSLPTGSVTRLSKSAIQKDLETVHRKQAEQIILPSILDVEDLGPFFHEDSINFAQCLTRSLKDSREKQRNLEAQIRKKMKKFGKEKRSIIYSPEEEVVKGFPEVELKWMFGNKEVVLPKAVGLHLYHGWKKWREEAKANLKQNLIKDAEFGRQYVAERQVPFHFFIVSILMHKLHNICDRIPIKVDVYYD